MWGIGKLMWAKLKARPEILVNPWASTDIPTSTKFPKACDACEAPKVCGWQGVHVQEGSLFADHDNRGSCKLRVLDLRRRREEGFKWNEAYS